MLNAVEAQAAVEEQCLKNGDSKIKMLNFSNHLKKETCSVLYFPLTIPIPALLYKTGLT